LQCCTEQTERPDRINPLFLSLHQLLAQGIGWRTPAMSYIFGTMAPESRIISMRV
jgi:hypothetical protein